MLKLYLFDQYDELTDAFLERALQVLPEARRDRAMRYRKKVDLWNCVLAYLMLQYALRKFNGIVPFKIALEPNGKPYLPDYPNVHFNISHCKRGCVVAVADYPVGVDIQEIRPFSWDVARRVCCEDELAFLLNCKDKDRAFIRIWVKKESWVKKSGVGIGSHLKNLNSQHGDLGRVVIDNANYIVALA